MLFPPVCGQIPRHRVGKTYPIHDPHIEIESVANSDEKREEGGDEM